jgi:hypothetical protein
MTFRTCSQSLIVIYEYIYKCYGEYYIVTFTLHLSGTSVKIECAEQFPWGRIEAEFDLCLLLGPLFCSGAGGLHVC